MDSSADLKLARAAAESRLQTMLSLVPPAINENALNSFWAALNSAQQHLVDIDKRLSTWQSATVASSECGKLDSKARGQRGYYWHCVCSQSEWQIFIISARHCILDETFDADGRSLNPPNGHVTANLFAFGQRLQYVGSRASDDVAVLRFESDHPDSGLPPGYALYNLDVERERQAVLGTEILILAYPKAIDTELHQQPRPHDSQPSCDFGRIVAEDASACVSAGSYSTSEYVHQRIGQCCACMLAPASTLLIVLVFSKQRL
eukprot:17635-Heterococcus_DN1.PRE.2